MPYRRAPPRRGGGSPSTDLERLLGGAFVLELGAQLAQPRFSDRLLVEIAAARPHRELELLHGRAEVAAAHQRLGLRAMLLEATARGLVGARLQLVELAVVLGSAQALVQVGEHLARLAAMQQLLEV